MLPGLSANRRVRFPTGYGRTRIFVPDRSSTVDRSTDRQSCQRSALASTLSFSFIVFVYRDWSPFIDIPLYKGSRFLFPSSETSGERGLGARIDQLLCSLIVTFLNHRRGRSYSGLLWCCRFPRSPGRPTRWFPTKPDLHSACPDWFPRALAFPTMLVYPLRR